MALGPTYYAKMLSAVTGETITSEALMETAERVFSVLKAYNTRQGFTRKDDTWPERFFTEPMPEGPAKGAMLSHAVIDRVLDEYYSLRKWDSRGLPTGQRLTELGLGDIANELVELSRITWK
jgi:aldehyde:ferredoxin oxidoreductase